MGDRKLGHWIDNGEYVTTAYDSLHIYTCSICDADITIDGYDSFCPNCGAEMVFVDTSNTN